MKIFSYFFRAGLFRLVGRLLTIATVLLILLAVIGHTVRDRTVELALLMYIPLLPLGLWAILLDGLQAGRSWPSFRFSLTFIGLGLMSWGGLSMLGTGGAETDLGPSTKVSVLHWNVYWGGRKNSWKSSISQDIMRHNPDIAILSETPSKYRLNFLLKPMGWSTIMYEETRGNPLAVCSSWPLRFERYVKIRGADAMTVIVTVHGQPLRVLAVDGGRNMSKKFQVLSKQVLPRWRVPMLTDIVQTIEAYHAKGQPVDIIAGDFNAISRSIGFDRFADAGGGYYLASKFSWNWRGTWKSYLPLYDIDHVWIHKRFQGLRAELFTNPMSDHYGQLVQFQLVGVQSFSFGTVNYKDSLIDTDNNYKDSLIDTDKDVGVQSFSFGTVN